MGTDFPFEITCIQLIQYSPTYPQRSLDILTKGTFCATLHSGGMYFLLEYILPVLFQLYLFYIYKEN
ncbi:MAG: hypothetical protein COU32_01970 [Candidatus Magasanikbacteria bacterium CG10_big_fil_rev_8_21_14_0_10_42_10]|uniref:Uncharacterized protein n=2 Tax=Candidatus Magasanikiibacteriota TaxID=1752731 RepID=A0A2H0TY44_9BACT|nr:MAG: hypothetical protein COU32_01970 [Candidatus Magasanikbacteria bacterium CG10_big_fil_rev_8_21_14_0_10_42_10]PIZ92548.1 MAG: hypothetical protein COX82_04565 [Candidatus Magasanikbacteria bacterium CG_4_10_14_0_2_um_filter_41_10]